MMPLPTKFDHNEWFLLLALFISFSIILFIPKRIPVSISILIMLFSIVVARLTDHILSAPRTELYQIMDTEKYELFDLLLYFLYAPFAYIFVYVYYRLNIKGMKILFYIIVCSTFGTLFEWITVEFRIFDYKSWNLQYSFSIYLVSQACTLLLFMILWRRFEDHRSK
ncbi:hypothetical protein FZW96_19510 [Bacillus sp. BGMRC 2118]|nr:hypothetical protein FZW96_19510 [Bacillus sp. BGMRC 2118]